MSVLLNTERLAREGTSLSINQYSENPPDDARAVVRAVEKAASLG